MNALDNFENISFLGEGTFGVVRLFQDKKTKEKFAIKILNKRKIISIKDQMRVKRELSFLKIIHHINVIKAKKILEDSKYIYIIMEYCENGELYDIIAENICLEEDQASYYYYQLINGLENIHRYGIVHRDLKPDNLLISKGNILKIIDFSLSCCYNKNTLLSTRCGSTCYASPELISGKKYDGFMTDIWSTGVILYFMLCGFLPFDDEDDIRIYKKILECKVKFPDNFGDDAIDLIKKILVNKPEKRITIKEIKKHNFYLRGKKVFCRIHPNLVGNEEKKYEKTYFGFYSLDKNKKVRNFKKKAINLILKDTHYKFGKINNINFASTTQKIKPSNIKNYQSEIRNKITVDKNKNKYAMEVKKIKRTISENRNINKNRLKSNDKNNTSLNNNIKNMKTTLFKNILHNSFTKNNTDKKINIIIPKYEDNNKNIMKEIINYEYIPNNILNTKRSRNNNKNNSNYIKTDRNNENYHIAFQNKYNTGKIYKKFLKINDKNLAMKTNNLNSDLINDKNRTIISTKLNPRTYAIKLKYKINNMPWKLNNRKENINKLGIKKFNINVNKLKIIPKKEFTNILKKNNKKNEMNKIIQGNETINRNEAFSFADLRNLINYQKFPILDSSNDTHINQYYENENMLTRNKKNKTCKRNYLKKFFLENGILKKNISGINNKINITLNNNIKNMMINLNNSVESIKFRNKKKNIAPINVLIKKYDTYHNLSKINFTNKITDFNNTAPNRYKKMQENISSKIKKKERKK